MRICCSDLKTKRELAVSVESLREKINVYCDQKSFTESYLVGKNDELETKEIVRVGEFCFTGFGKFQFIDVLETNRR